MWSLLLLLCTNLITRPSHTPAPPLPQPQRNVHRHSSHVNSVRVSTRCRLTSISHPVLSFHYLPLILTNLILFCIHHLILNFFHRSSLLLILHLSVPYVFLFISTSIQSFPRIFHLQTLQPILFLNYNASPHLQRNFLILAQLS